MKSSSFDSMIMTSASATGTTKNPYLDVVDRSQLKSSELSAKGEKKSVMSAIKDIVRFRKSKNKSIN